MRSFLRTVVLFLALALPLNLVLLIVWGEVVPAELRGNLYYPHQVYGHLHSRLAEADRIGQVDVLIMGSSKAYRGFDTRVWEAKGYRTFNLGSTGQTPLQGEVLLSRYLGTMRPRLVVLEVDPVPFMDTGAEASLDLLANGPADLSALHMAYRVGDLRTWTALIFCTWQQVTGRTGTAPEAARMGLDRYIPGGYVEREDEQVKITQEVKPRKVAMREDQLAAFDRMLERLKQEKIPFVLVNAPVTTALTASLSGLPAFHRAMEQRGTYLDMNGNVALEDQLHFYDKGHLNRAGVALFNAALIDTLAQRGLLPRPE